MKLTVILRDDSPFIHVGGRPKYRSVQIQLTVAQVDEIRGRTAYERENEIIDNCFIEPEPRNGI